MVFANEHHVLLYPKNALRIRQAHTGSQESSSGEDTPEESEGETSSQGETSGYDTPEESETDGDF